MLQKPAFLLGLILSLSLPLHAQLKLQKPLWVHTGIGFVTAEQIQRAVETVSAEQNLHRRVYVIDNTASTPQGYPTFRVMGLTEKEVLDQVDDENGATCSKSHEQGDAANRWCHAAVVKTIDRTLQARGMNPALAAVIGAAFFVPKEYIYDKNPSASDLVAADLRVHSSKLTNVEVSVFGDGAIYISIQRKF